MDVPETLLKAIKSFRCSLRNSFYCVEHDVDVDGVAAGIITAVALRRTGYEAEPCAVERAEVFAPYSGALVLTDIAVDNEAARAVDSALKKGVDVYAIDHHPWAPGYRERLNAVVNPHFCGVPKASSWNAGLLAYITFRDVVPDYDWLAAVSAYTDMCIAPWSERLVERFGYENVRAAGDALTAFIAVKGPSELDRILLNSTKSIRDVLRDDRFKKAKYVFESAVEKYVRSPSEHALVWDEGKKLMVIEAGEQYNGLRSVVSTRISVKPEFRDWVVAVMGRDQKSQDYKVSIRCQDWEKRVNVGELARKVAEKLGGAGGGHPAAAGMRIPGSKKEEFVKTLHSLL